MIKSKWFTVVLAIMVYAAAASGDENGATRPAPTEFSPKAVVEKLLNHKVKAGGIFCDEVSAGFIVIRMADVDSLKPDSTRLHFSLRLTLNTVTSEIVDVRHEDYLPGELQRVGALRKKGVLAPEAVFAIVSDFIQPKNGFTKYPPPSEIDVDLVAGRYYVVRFPNPPYRAPGDLTPFYAARVFVDGLTGRILRICLGG